MDDSDSLNVWCAGEEWCPVTATATLIGKKWHPVIVHRLLEHGPLGFAALQREVDGVSGKVLTEVLDDLTDNALVERRMISDRPFRVEYSLTDRGETLRPVITAMAEWGDEHLVAADERSRNPTG